MKYNISFPIGDWSNDGHGRCDYFLVKSNYNKEKISNLTKSVKDILGFNLYQICAGYEECILSDNIVESLEKAGFNMSLDNEKYWEDCDDRYMSSDSIFNLWMDILQYLDPQFKYEEFSFEVIYADVPGYGVFY